jgi:hypothetical protein
VFASGINFIQSVMKRHQVVRKLNWGHTNSAQWPHKPTLLTSRKNSSLVQSNENNTLHMETYVHVDDSKCTKYSWWSKYNMGSRGCDLGARLLG